MFEPDLQAQKPYLVVEEGVVSSVVVPSDVVYNGVSDVLDEDLSPGMVDVGE